MRAIFESAVPNNFPWQTHSDAQKINIEQTTQAILDASAKYSDCVAELFKRLEYCTEKVVARTVGGLFPKENSPFFDANVCKTRKRKTLLATFNYACSE